MSNKVQEVVNSLFNISMNTLESYNLQQGGVLYIKFCCLVSGVCPREKRIHTERKKKLFYFILGCGCVDVKFNSTLVGRMGKRGTKKKNGTVANCRFHIQFFLAKICFMFHYNSGQTNILHFFIFTHKYNSDVTVNK